MEILSISEHLGRFEIPENIWKPLIPFFYAIKEEDPESDVMSNFGGWQKNNIHDCDEVLQLKQEFINKIHEYIQWIHKQYYIGKQDPKWTISIDNVFVNINPKGSYHVMHRHVGSNYSGVFYLQSDERTSGPLYIQHPFSSPWTVINQSKDFYTRIDPIPGTGIVFPSYLLHHVTPNMSEDDRVAVSFNFTVYFNEQVNKLFE